MWGVCNIEVAKLWRGYKKGCFQKEGEIQEPPWARQCASLHPQSAVETNLSAFCVCVCVCVCVCEIERD